MEWKGLSPGAKLVYAKLAQCAGKNGKAFPSQCWLAEKLSLSKRSVNEHIASLIELRLIKTRTRQHTKALQYLFLWHPAMGPAEDFSEVQPHNARAATYDAEFAYRKELLSKYNSKLSDLDGLLSALKELLARESQPARSFPENSKSKSISGPTRILGPVIPNFAISDRWPLLFKTGFGQSQINQLFPKLLENESLSVPDLAERFTCSLNHVEALLERGPIIDKHGNLVRNPKGYIFAALSEDGHFSPPPGWVSPEELQARQDELHRLEMQKREQARVEKQQARKKELEREMDDRLFQEWFDALSPAQLQELKNLRKDSYNTIKNFKFWLRVIYWPQNIKNSMQAMPAI